MNEVNVQEPVIEQDAKCPECGYNLRGLTKPQCPECGLKFTRVDAVRWQYGGHDRHFHVPWLPIALISLPIVLIGLLAVANGWACIFLVLLSLVPIAVARRWMK